MRRLRRILAVLSLAVLAASCGAPAVPAPGSAGSPVGGVGGPPDRPASTLRVGLGRDPVSLDPRLIADDEGELIVRALFDGLVDVGPSGRIIPAAATWTVEDGGLTYRFTLRPDRFHDGTPVTAQHHADALLAVLDDTREPRFRQDLVASLLGAAAGPTDPQVPPSGEGPEVASWGSPEDVLEAGGVEVVGERELVIRLERPDPLVLHRLSDPVLVPLPALARDDPERFVREPVGNGPFRMLGPREPGAFIRIGANADHPRPPQLDVIVFQVYANDPDREQRWSDLLSGRLQITAVPADRRDEARERFGDASARFGSGLHDEHLAVLYGYGFALDVAPFDDPVLRRALSAAIDREALALELAGAGVEPADAIIPPSLGGGPADCTHCRYDPELAAELIAGWRAGRPEGALEPRVTLSYPRGGGHVTIAERMASHIERALDLEVRLQAREFGAHVRAVVEGEAPVFRYGIRASLGGEAAAISMIDPAFRPAARANWVGWTGPAAATLLDASEEAGASSTAVARAIEAEVLDAAAVIPLLWTRSDLVVHPDVAGFRMDPTGRWWPETLRLR